MFALLLCTSMSVSSVIEDAAHLEPQDISDPRSDVLTIYESIESLGKNRDEPPSFWTRLANNPLYSAPQRSLYALGLFKHHIRAEIPLFELGLVLEGAKWLDDDDLVHFPLIGGFVPVKGCPSRDSIFSIQLKGWQGIHCIYLSVPGKVTTSEMIKCLKGSQEDPSIRNIRLLDVSAK